ncbi:hypothetical protein [Streptomyces anandii]|uniref:hypothetical protein n=1 Tax=Streptomyces anandii TaxID=285454 RepID=UPI001678878A|nr:hypothetical protein [Streptomyces anandii]GGX79203.1 hypothetical protein GCM10010510_25190 [Streptomyces anandii JCM 4720]
MDDVAQVAVLGGAGPVAEGDAERGAARLRGQAGLHLADVPLTDAGEAGTKALVLIVAGWKTSAETVVPAELCETLAGHQATIRSSAVIFSSRLFGGTYPP